MLIDHTGDRVHHASSLGTSAGSLDLVCFSHLRWHFVTQRPQHLLTRCARDRRVFFWEEPWFDADERHASIPTLEVIDESRPGQPTLWVLRPHLPRAGDASEMQRALLDTFLAEHGVAPFLAWYYTPMALAFTGHLHPAVIVYDCMDELTGFLGAPPELAEREQALFARADVVFTGGISLYEAKRRQHANVHAFPSSIDTAHFGQAREGLPDPVDQSAIPHPRAGFFGVLDERLDRDLLAEVAKLRPDVHFILLGPVVKIDPASLPQAANIHYPGGKDYRELPAYLAHWDVALLPFARNEATRFISPTKTPEYLAAGKPVVSTPIHDVVTAYGNAGLVRIAHNAQEFAQAIDASLQPQPAEWSNAVAEKLAQSSWDQTWHSMWQQIERVLIARADAKTNPRRSAAIGIRTENIVPFRMAPVTVRASLGSARASRPVHSERFDYLIAGAGLAGAVLAERLANGMGKRVLIFDKRDHIAGNTFDFYDAAGILVHKYGPHIFHTNSAEVVAYLSRFTEWRNFEHRVLASVDGQLLPIPINLDTINRLYNLSLDGPGMQAFLATRTQIDGPIRTSEDIVVSRVGRELYEKFFRNYTRKQWGLDPAELDASVAGRIPVRFDRDDRYFTDSFQAMPFDGYTRMFERMLDSPNIVIRTGVPFGEIARSYPGTQIVFTGPVDEYFDYRFGPLPYRSLEFRHQTFDRERFQDAPVINYPNEHEYTRVTEFKYLTGQVAPRTSVVFEYPRAEGDPYYPIPRPENAALYASYRTLAEQEAGVHFVGRLATYKYYNMDQVVAQALLTYRRISGLEPAGKIGRRTALAAQSAL